MQSLDILSRRCYSKYCVTLHISPLILGTLVVDLLYNRWSRTAGAAQSEQLHLNQNKKHETSVTLVQAPKQMEASEQQLF